MPTLGMKKSSELRMITDRSSEGAGTGIPEKHPPQVRAEFPHLGQGSQVPKPMGVHTHEAGA